MFEIYKRGQGKWARYIAAGCVGVLIMYGCYSLHEYLNTGSLSVPIVTIPGVDLDMNVAFIISFGLFLALAATIYLLLNKPKLGDFLIETEVEMKRVSWPSRSELVGSSTIVVITVVILAIIIMIFDFAAQAFMRLLYGIG
jgi:preprotein translocase subunit SecE